MHTIIVISSGLLVLAGCVMVARLLGASAATAALVFLPVWLIGSGVNMYVGVTRAGYTVAQETPIFLLVFAVPAAVAVFVWFKLR
jgi:hypothetical protein